MCLLNSALFGHYIYRLGLYLFRSRYGKHRLEKAKQTDIWPFRVGVRMFKHFSTKPNPEQMTFEKQTIAKGIQPIHPSGSKASSPEKQQPEEISTSKRFDVLQTQTALEAEFVF